MSNPYSSLTPFELRRDEEDSSDVQSDQKNEESNLSKSERIQKCIERLDIKGLRKLGREKGGFINKDLRKIVWPMITRVNPDEPMPKLSEKRLQIFEDFRELPEEAAHDLREDFDDFESYKVLCQDVPRTFLFKFEETEKDEYYRQQMKRICFQIILTNEDYYFYQGYLDFFAVFLNLLDEKMTFHIMNSISRSHLEKFLNPDSYPQSKRAQIEMVILIVGAEKPDLRKFLEAAECNNVVDTIWFISWGIRRVRKLSNLARLFDLFLSSDPLMPVYFFTAIVLNYNDKILELKLHSVENFLKHRIFRREREFPFEDIIYKARCLLLKYPPESLPKYQPLEPMELDKIRMENSERSSPPPSRVPSHIVPYALESIHEQIDSIDSKVDEEKNDSPTIGSSSLIKLSLIVLVIAILYYLFEFIFSD